GKYDPNGTGFYVSVIGGKDSAKGYIATAKHVLKKSDGSFINQIFIRVPKLMDSTLTTIKIDLHTTGLNKNVFIHPDTTVDIAVISTVPNSRLYDIKFLPNSYLTTRQ